MTAVDTIMRPVKAPWGASWLLAASRASAAILIGADENELVTDLAVRFPEAKLVPDEAWC